MPPIITFNPNLAPDQLAELLRLLGEIDEFKGRWRKLGEIRAERLASLRQVATIESAGSSTRIEGAQLSDDEVARVLQGLRVDSFRERDEGEVRGSGELLQTIFDNYREIPLTENYVKHLHKILLGHVERDAWHRGEYKKHPNPVEARYPDGQVETIFQTASPFDTPRLMSELVAASNQALDGDAVHPLVVVAGFAIAFLAIHPFQDGNGRLSRALTALMMMRAGYEYIPYASVERIVEENKTGYYHALRVAQQAMQTDPADFGAWLLFFLRVLQSQKRVLAGKLEIERSVVRLKDVQVRVLEMVERRARATTREVADALSIDQRAARYHLALLVERGLLEAHGERRGRYYSRQMAPPPEPATEARSTNAAILADILERGGTVSKRELMAIMDAHGVDHRMVGILHGRRKAHLRRNTKTQSSTLTARGRELAEQYLFARRLSQSVTPRNPAALS
jgi:Fic family protein